MAASVAEGVLRSVYDGCIAAGCDSDIDRRPYHRNCSCALHKSKSGRHCPRGGSKCKSVKYPLRRAWSEGCLALVASSGSAHSSPSSSPVVVAKSQLAACNEE